MIRLSLGACAIIVLLQCTGTLYHPLTYDKSVLYGRILLPDSSGALSVHAGIPGTSWQAFSDSSGSFVLGGIDQGFFTLLINGAGPFHKNEFDYSAVTIYIGENKIIDLGRIVLEPVTKNYTITSFTALGSNGTAVNFSPTFGWVTINDSGRIILQGGPIRDFTEVSLDTLCLLFQTVTSVRYKPSVLWVTLTHNEKVLYDTLSDKGNVRTDWYTAGAQDTINIQINHGNPISLVIRNPLQFKGSALSTAPQNFLLITTGNPGVRSYIRGPGTTPYFTYYDNAVKIGTDTVIVSFARFEPIDWDIRLVNDGTGDTCSRSHPVADSSIENGPEFSGDGLGQFESFYSLKNNPYADSYEPDRISAVDAPDGRYSVFVKYYDGPVDSTTAMPVLCIEMGKPYTGKAFESLFILRPPSTLSPGDIWFAGRILLPEWEFDTTGQAVMRD